MALDGGMPWLAVVAAVNWVIAPFVYLRAIGPAFLDERVGARSIRTRGYAAVHATTAVATLALAVLPGAILRLLR